MTINSSTLIFIKSYNYQMAHIRSLSLNSTQYLLISVEKLLVRSKRSFSMEASYFRNQQMVAVLHFNRFAYVILENTTMLKSKYVCHAQIKIQERTSSSNKNVKIVETCGSTQYLNKDLCKLSLLLRYVKIQQKFIMNCMLKKKRKEIKKEMFWVLKTFSLKILSQNRTIKNREI